MWTRKTWSGSHPSEERPFVFADQDRRHDNGMIDSPYGAYGEDDEHDVSDRDFPIIRVG